MSQEDVEIVRRVLDAWNRHDIETILALCDPEVEFVNSPTAIEPGTRRGHDAYAAAMQAQWEILADAHAEIERVYDRGEEILTLGRLSRRMPDSDARIDDRFLLSWSIRDGKLTRLENRFGRAEVQEALKAAGLSE